jgi:hypothetical protein
MHLLIFVILQLCLCTETKAQDPQDEYDEIYGNGSKEFSIERFDNDSVLLAIRRDMEVACDKKGLCTLSAVTSNDRRFTTQFFIGQGNMMGGMNTGSGTTVIVPGSYGYGYSNEPYVGFNLRFTIGKCTQTVRVPRALYISMNRYLYGLMTEEGGTRRGFTPADEAMIMFYSTIMKEASGCVAGQ